MRKIVHGPGVAEEKPVIVVMHEGLGCIGMWHDFPEVLAKAAECDVLVFDRYGYGDSEPLPHGRGEASYFYREAWEFLPQVLRVCGVGECAFFGHSDGGTIALLYTSRYPEKVRAVISESAHVYVDDLTIEGIADAVRAYEKTDFKSRLTRYHGDNTEFMFRRWAETWLSPGHRAWTIEDDLKKITSPVLVIQGADDQYGTIGQVESIADHVSGRSEKFVIPDCRHVPHHEKQGEVLDQVRSFLNNLN